MPVEAQEHVNAKARADFGPTLRKLIEAQDLQPWRATPEGDVEDEDDGDDD